MLFLNKLLPIFLLPTGLAALLLIGALVRRKWWLVAGALAVLYVGSMQVVSRALLGSLEQQYVPVRVDDAGPADAVIVLGGIFGGPRMADGYIPNVADSVERLEAGIQLQLHHRAEWLIFTGAKIPWEGRLTVEGEDSRRVALSRGVRGDRILITGNVGNTWDEAKAMAVMMRERHWLRVLLVTSAWHMPRAERLFRAAGVNFAPFPVDYRIDPHRHVSPLDFLPKGEALAETETALREYYGRWFYALTGR